MINLTDEVALTFRVGYSKSIPFFYTKAKEGFKIEGIY